jgi:hypothetical protein
VFYGFGIPKNKCVEKNRFTPLAANRTPNCMGICMENRTCRWTLSPYILLRDGDLSPDQGHVLVDALVQQEPAASQLQGVVPGVDRSPGTVRCDDGLIQRRDSPICKNYS